MNEEILINKTKLKLLLEEKKEEIGHSLGEGVEIGFSGLTFLLTSLFAGYKNVWILSAETMKVICILIGLGLTLHGAAMTIKYCMYKYNHNSLYHDIVELDEAKHCFSLVAIKDTYNRHSNRFLLYHDERWGCRLFLNYRTQKPEQKNEDSIRSRLSNELKIDISEIEVAFKAQAEQRKFSASSGKYKTYEHRLYCAQLKHFDGRMKKKNFKIDGKRFCWMTIQEMEEDPDIQRNNLDVVNFVKSNIG